MNNGITYDVAIAGGGLAGLSCAILLSMRGYRVAVFEKEKYPFHKVCGEYLSMESHDFLLSLGIPLHDLQLPRISKLVLTAPAGQSLRSDLPLGGMGISRYLLDQLLWQKAAEKGVALFEETKVEQIRYHELFTLQTSKGNYKAITCCAAFGKHSNLDVKWNRKHLDGHDKKLENFIAVKYHLHTNWPDDTIGLHNFEDGYCGISQIENGRYNLCYMIRAESLKKNGGRIPKLEENVLHRNPHLKRIFENSRFENDFPITISQINFKKKSLVEDHILMLGDAAGLIAPLCGNGMSMALHMGKIAASVIDLHLKGEINKQQMEELYTRRWLKAFSVRMRAGRLLQRFFGHKMLSQAMVNSFRIMPFLARPVIRLTHGKPFKAQAL